MNASSPVRIEKEQLGTVSFPKNEVLGTDDAMATRNAQLQKACKLGNLFKGKVRIQFLTNQGPREIYTTIWNVSRRYIGLKNGADIPIHAIFNVVH